MTQALGRRRQTSGKEQIACACSHCIDPPASTARSGSGITQTRYASAWLRVHGLQGTFSSWPFGQRALASSV
nr:putative integron gene cassette protein [uncultured bacterium]